MQIRYEKIKLDKDFPFSLTDMYLQPHSDMDGWFHWHDCFEIAYIKSGTGTYFVENKAFAVNKGDIVIINDIEPHQLRVDDEVFNQINIVFSPSLIWSGKNTGLDYEFILPFFKHDSSFNNRIDTNNPYAAEIIGYIDVLTNEYIEKTNGWQLMIKAKLLCLLTLLFRHFCTEGIQLVERQNRLKLQKAFEYIENNYTSEISLKKAAESVFLSPPYFSALFNKVAHMNFIDYVVETRIRHAIGLLTTTCETVTCIAVESGFHNMGNFNAAFKKVTGQTPSEYRNSI